MSSSRTHELHKEVHHYRELFERASVGISRQNLEGIFIEANPKACEIYGVVKAAELIGQHFTFNFHPDDIARAQEWASAMVGGYEHAVALDNRIIRPDGIIAHIRTNVSRTNDHFIVVVEDITEHKEHEERQKLLLDELNHRVKNTLATVQSISMQTMRSVENDPVEFRRRFQSRLLSLSKAHDLLTNMEWQGAELGDVIALTLAPYMSSSGCSIMLSGDPVHLSPNAAVTLNMVFHELATNAAKYGSLSVPDGSLSITWHYDRPKSPTGVHITWTERNGPPVVEPTRKGFGTRMIQTGPQTELWAKTTMSFNAAGMECVLDIPFTQKVSVPVKKRTPLLRRKPRTA